MSFTVGMTWKKCGERPTDRRPKQLVNCVMLQARPHSISGL